MDRIRVELFEVLAEVGGRDGLPSGRTECVRTAK
jgi:hypothetical protein